MRSSFARWIASTCSGGRASLRICWRSARRLRTTARAIATPAAPRPTSAPAVTAVLRGTSQQLATTVLVEPQALESHRLDQAVVGVGTRRRHVRLVDEVEADAALGAQAAAAVADGVDLALDRGEVVRRLIEIAVLRIARVHRGADHGDRAPVDALVA